MKRPLNEELQDQQQRGILLVLTGPSGAGKDTVLDYLQQKDPSAIKIITTTSRALRQNETEGKPYYFLSREEFTKKIEERAFFEWMEFRGELYGTQRVTIQSALDTGKNVIWRIDTQGVKNIKEEIKSTVDHSVFVFLSSPIEVLKERVKRDEGEKFETRWDEALVKSEMEQYGDCDYLVENQEGKLDETIELILTILRAKRLEIRHADES